MMACAVKELDVGGIGAGNPQLGRLKKSLTLPYGVRFEQTKLQMEALAPITYMSFRVLVRPPAGFRV
jgi:hypothetical protein